MSFSPQLRQRTALATALAAATACTSSPSTGRSQPTPTPSSAPPSATAETFSPLDGPALLSRDRSDPQWQQAFETWKGLHGEVAAVGAPAKNGGTYVSKDGDLFPWGQVAVRLTEGSPIGPNIVGVPDGNSLRAIEAAAELTAEQRAQLTNLASQPQGQWLGYWALDHPNVVADTAAHAADLGHVPMFVLYGVADSEARENQDYPYKDWAATMLDQIAQEAPDAVVIIEPDTVPFVANGEVEEPLASDRLSKVELAVDLAVERGLANRTYIDSGGADWLSAPVAAQALVDVGVTEVAGSSQNVSGFGETEANISFGRKVMAAVEKLTGQRKGVVIDVGRNGAGVEPQDLAAPFNLRTAAVGESSSSARQADILDATLMVKPLLQSDENTGTGPLASDRAVPCPPAGEVCLPLGLSMLENRNNQSGKAPLAQFAKDGSLVLVWPDAGVRIYGPGAETMDLTLPPEVASTDARVTKVQLSEADGQLNGISLSLTTTKGPATLSFGRGEAPEVATGVKAPALQR